MVSKKKIGAAIVVALTAIAVAHYGGNPATWKAKFQSMVDAGRHQSKDAKTFMAWGRGVILRFKGQLKQRSGTKKASFNQAGTYDLVPPAARRRSRRRKSRKSRRRGPSRRRRKSRKSRKRGPSRRRRKSRKTRRRRY